MIFFFLNQTSTEWCSWLIYFFVLLGGGRGCCSIQDEKYGLVIGFRDTVCCVKFVDERGQRLNLVDED